MLSLTQTRSHSIFALSPVLLNTLCRQKVDAVASAKLTTNILEYSVLTFKKKMFLKLFLQYPSMEIVQNMSWYSSSISCRPIPQPCPLFILYSFLPVEFLRKISLLTTHHALISFRLPFSHSRF